MLSPLLSPLVLVLATLASLDHHVTLAAPTGPEVATGSQARSIRIPLSKRASSLLQRRASDDAEAFVDPPALLRARKALYRKYAHLSPDKGALTKRATGTVSLVDEQSGSLWQGPITIGGQTFNIDFDTGSSDLWVISNSCSTGGCVGHNKYTLSSTGKLISGETLEISYADGGTSSGPVYTESISLGGIAITNQTFAAATEVSSDFASSNNPSDGICGLAFEALADLNATTVFETMMAQGVVSEPVFSFSLRSTGSELFLGGVDTSSYTGSITYTPVLQEVAWLVAIGGVQSGSSSASISGQYAIIDTGTTLVYGSYSDVDAIYATIPGSESLTAIYGSQYQGYYSYPCSSESSISFVFGGTAFPIPASAFSQGRVQSTGSTPLCVGGIVGQDPETSGLGSNFIVGDVFLQGVTAVFTHGTGSTGSTVGFAISSEAGSSNTTGTATRTLTSTAVPTRTGIPDPIGTSVVTSGASTPSTGAPVTVTVTGSPSASAAKNAAGRRREGGSLGAVLPAAVAVAVGFLVALQL